MAARRVHRSVRFLFENSLFLIAGAVIALLWANTSHATYEHFIHMDLLGFIDDPETKRAVLGFLRLDEKPGGLSLHFFVNDVLMALSLIHI